jgi:Zyg-11 family protein
MCADCVLATLFNKHPHHQHQIEKTNATFATITKQLEALKASASVVQEGEVRREVKLALEKKRFETKKQIQEKIDAAINELHVERATLNKHVDTWYTTQKSLMPTLQNVEQADRNIEDLISRCALYIRLKNNNASQTLKKLDDMINDLQNNYNSVKNASSEFSVDLSHITSGMLKKHSEQHLYKSLYLINLVLMESGKEGKAIMGRLGLVQLSTEIISSKLEANVYDDAFNMAWALLWNVTDETPDNSNKFIDNNGVDLLVRTLETSGFKQESAIGTMGNVSEVQHQRPKLRTPAIAKLLLQMLQFSGKDVLLSFEACGILANLLSNLEPLAWHMTVGMSPNMSTVLGEMKKAILIWDMKAKMLVQYNSFQPMYLLLSENNSPEVQHWAVWAICYFTKFDKKKYCTMLTTEKGQPLLETIIADPRPYAEVKELVRQILDTSTKYSQDPGYDSN